MMSKKINHVFNFILKKIAPPKKFSFDIWLVEQPSLFKYKKRAAIFYILPKNFNGNYKGGHTNTLDAYLWTKALNELGYVVDFYDRTCDSKQIRKLNYDLLLANISGGSSEMLPKNLLDQSEHKIGLLTSTHPKTRESQLQNRIKQDKSGVAEKALLSRKPNLIFEKKFDSFNYAISIGSEGSLCWRSYNDAFDKLENYKPSIPWLRDTLHSIPDKKDRTHFVCLSGSGFILKGIDILIRAFSKFPDYTLDIYMDFDNNDDKKALKIFKEYEEIPTNVNLCGSVNVNSTAFQKNASKAMFGITMSCSEGLPTSNIILMRMGLIPLHTAAVERLTSEQFIIDDSSDVLSELCSHLKKIHGITNSHLIKLSKNAIYLAKKYEPENSKETMKVALRKLDAN